MEAGAFGMSSGLIYPPGCYAATNEIAEMCKIIENYGGFYATHIRNEGDKLEDALTEAIEISRLSGVRLQVSHLKTSGSRNWYKVKNIKTIIERAIDEGIDITCDRYPYIAAATDLDVILPNWVYEGGIADQINRLKDTNTRQQIAKEVSQSEDDASWNGIMISSVYYDKNKWMEGKTITEISKELNKPPIETVFDLLIEEETRVDIFCLACAKKIWKRYWVGILSLSVLIVPCALTREYLKKGNPTHGVMELFAYFGKILQRKETPFIRKGHSEDDRTSCTKSRIE